MEKNKTGKYFKYAIGEIILVVIGILIALQINNWNENRKLKESKTEYYEQLLSEINLDIKELNPQIKRVEQSINTYESYLAIFEKSNVSLDSIYHHIKKVEPTFGLIRFNTKTIEVLKSTGDIKLLPKSIKNLLISLENQQNLLSKNQDNNYGMYLNTIEDTYLINPFSVRNLIENQEQFFNALKIETSFADQIAKYHLALTIKNFAEINALRILKETLNLTNDLKNIIEEELEHQ
ncbi:hypothetical protein AB8P51_15050 [Muriicola sp. SD30]|uniref:hypothetical protein n=1 Tax=Muriicola sp. SD30 TaxID=3240936 RepID=UPI003510374A